MKDIIKELWYKYKVRTYSKLIRALTESRRQLNQKQKQCTLRREHYLQLYNNLQIK